MHEANLVFDLASRFADGGIPFELEWRSPVGRHDIAVKDDKLLFGIIEAKRTPKTRPTFQISRYKSLGVPVLIVHFQSDKEQVVEEVNTWLEKGIPISSLSDRPGLIKKAKRFTKKQRFINSLDPDLNFRD
jgi:hypothetical protein